MRNWNLPPGATEAHIDAHMCDPEEVQCSVCKLWVDVTEDDDAIESIYYRGSVRVVCSPCAAQAEDYGR